MAVGPMFLTLKPPTMRPSMRHTPGLIPIPTGVRLRLFSAPFWILARMINTVLTLVGAPTHHRAIRSFLVDQNENPFVINAGLNDAWFNPETDGQGFFISVFPGLGAYQTCSVGE